MIRSPYSYFKSSTRCSVARMILEARTRVYIESVSVTVSPSFAPLPWGCHVARTARIQGSQFNLGDVILHVQLASRAANSRFGVRGFAPSSFDVSVTVSPSSAPG